TPLQTRLGFGVVAPVVQPMLVHLAQSNRNVDERIPIRATGFEEQHENGGIFVQTACNHATRRTGSDDYVIVGGVLRHAKRQRHNGCSTAIGYCRGCQPTTSRDAAATLPESDYAAQRSLRSTRRIASKQISWSNASEVYR